MPANPNPARVLNISFGGSAACNAAYQDVIDELAEVGVAGGDEEVLLGVGAVVQFLVVDHHRVGQRTQFVGVVVIRHRFLASEPAL